jgi:hypothetical protein
MRCIAFARIVIANLILALSATAESRIVFSGESRQNNLVAKLLEVAEISQPRDAFTFKRALAGYIFVSADCRGNGTVTIKLDDLSDPLAVIKLDVNAAGRAEAIRYISRGDHKLHVKCAGDIRVEKLAVKAIPELMHCGLGFDPAIKSYGKYDLAFLAKDILPNVTTLIVPHNIQLEAEMTDNWRRQGKRFLAAVGINSQAKAADEHFDYWTSFMEKAPYLNGVIIDEFIVNNPIREWLPEVTPERQQRFDQLKRPWLLFHRHETRLQSNWQPVGDEIH